ncbi:MAG: long-chain-fatty-acid--CoA ligase [Caulobacter sp.]|nr:long-chain-fatty-acid--CoA ligase [Caulobacter sp.]
MRGLMQDQALTVDKILDHAKNWHGHVEVVSRSVEGPIVRTTYGQIHGRAKRVSNLLLQLGVTLGDRVATLAWNTARHMEAWYGIMSIGAVCHTLNPRLHPEQIAWIINHAEDKIIFVDLTFVPILEAILAQCPTVEHVVVMTDQSHMPGFKIHGVPSMKWGAAHCYETAIAGQSEQCAWGGFDENTACGLCYTSGTTGDPKGVLYSHRSNVIHCLVGLQKDVLGMSGVDTVLPVVPMFHANAWGTAFACPAVGAKMVMPGSKMDGASIYELLDGEQVTFSAAVPTVWQMLLAELDAKSLKLPHLTKVVIGGSACPESLIRGFKERYDVDVLHAWGMTETSPLGTLGSPNARVAKLSYDEQMPYKLKQGRPPFGIEMKLTDDEGRKLPHDGSTFGHLMVKGPFVVGQYFKGAGGTILDVEGFFDTGDVATIDPEGFMQITDRAKDVIKSGGEWISTIDIENIAMGHPKAELAAVIGILHPKWDERPLLLVKLKPGETATKEEFIDFLSGKIAKWWTPDDVVFVDDIPLGATGKIDKKVLRARFADYVLPEVPLMAAMAAAAATPSMALRSEPDPLIHAPEPAAPEAPETADPFEAAAAGAEAEGLGFPAAAETPQAEAAPEDGPEEGNVAGAADDIPDVAEAEKAPDVREDLDASVQSLLADPADPPAPEPVAKAVPGPAPIAEALIAGAAAAVAGGMMFTRDDTQREEPLKVTPVREPPPEPRTDAPQAEGSRAEVSATPYTPSGDASSPTPDLIPEGDLPLTWTPGASEPPRTEHVAGRKKADREDVPDALPSMPGMTPLGAAVAAIGEPALVRNQVERAQDPAAAEAMAFPASLKSSDSSFAASDEPPLSFTPLPAGGRKPVKPKTGLIDHLLTLTVALAFAPALIVLVGAAGMWLHQWDWREGYQSVLTEGPAANLGWAPAAAMVSLLVSFVGLLIAAIAGWKRYWRKALLAVFVTLVSLAGFAGLAWWEAQSPRIHDVATDWSEPLLFTDTIMSARGPDANIVEPNPVVPLDAGTFAGRPIAEINSETCSAARPAMVSLQPAQAFAAIKAAMLAEGLTIVTDDVRAGRLEATATSLLYRFKDDVAVRVRAQGVGSRIDIRSISRVGATDMGANCRRIGRLTAALNP